MDVEVQQLLGQLSRVGCCVGLLNIVFPAAVVWTKHNTVYWSQLSPQDQHHVHATKALKWQIYHNRDIGIWDDEGRWFYFAPVEEWFLNDMDSYLKEWEQWKVATSTKERRNEFAGFLRNCVGDAPDWLSN